MIHIQHVQTRDPQRLIYARGYVIPYTQQLSALVSETSTADLHCPSSPRLLLVTGIFKSFSYFSFFLSFSF